MPYEAVAFVRLPIGAQQRRPIGLMNLGSCTHAFCASVSRQRHLVVAKNRKTTAGYGRDVVHRPHTMVPNSSLTQDNQTGDELNNSVNDQLILIIFGTQNPSTT